MKHMCYRTDRSHQLQADALRDGLSSAQPGADVDCVSVPLCPDALDTKRGKPCIRSRFPARTLVFVLLNLMLGLPCLEAAVPIYSTEFEASEGYDFNYTLAGQNQWTGSGSGGNGLVDGFFSGLGQQAFIGYTPPAAGDDALHVWQPLYYDPQSSNTPVVVFSTVLAIYDSTNGLYDDFYWSFYNSQNDRLFSVDFDNNDLNIYYALDGTNALFVPTGWTISDGVEYELTITADFAANTWDADIGGTMIITNQPITTANAELTLGFVAATWSVRTPGSPGDNYMVFDNYQVTAEATPPPQPQLEVTAGVQNGATSLQVAGPNDYTFALEVSSNLMDWTALDTNKVTNGYADFYDPDAAVHPVRFYRVRWVP